VEGSDDPEKETRNMSSLILDTVYSVEAPILKESETVCASPLCSNRFKPGGMAASPKRHCSEQCRQECSIIKRAAKLLNVLSDVEIVKLIREQ
jgi:hypothetical protein